MEHIQKKIIYNNTVYTAYNNRTGIWQEKTSQKKKADLPIEHSSMSWLQAPPTKPAGQVQMARPLRGLVSHTAPSLQGLLTHASSRWHSKPVDKTHISTIYHTGLKGPNRQIEKPTYLSFQLGTRRKRMLHGHDRWHHWSKQLLHSHQCSHCSHLQSSHWRRHKYGHQWCWSKYPHYGMHWVAFDTHLHPQRSIVLVGRWNMGLNIFFMHMTCIPVFIVNLKSYTCPFWWTLAVVCINSIYTYSSIHALVTWAVIHIVLTVVSFKTWDKFKDKSLIARRYSSKHIHFADTNIFAHNLKSCFV